MSAKLLTEHNLESQSLKGSCGGSSESILVKTPQCLKSHVAAHIKALSHLQVASVAFRFKGVSLSLLAHIYCISGIISAFV